MIIFFGPAGSGKSLQGQILAARQGWAWISTGQLLRESADIELLEIMKKGQLVPDEKMNSIVKEALDRVPNTRTVILDGYPRKIDQARWLINNHLINGHSDDLIIVIDVPNDIVIKRLTGRGRADDKIETIKERLRIYHQENDAIIDYLTDNGVKIIHVDGSGKVGQIHDTLMEELSACKAV